MTKTYTFSECYALLDVDPKTFRRWLEKAGIDPEQQVSKMDNRIKYLTEQQVQQLAADHGRTLTPVEQRPQEGAAQGLIKLLAERLDTTGQLLSTALERISLLEHQQVNTRELLVTALERVAALEETPRRKSTAPLASKSTAEGLPDGLVSWRAFADLHHVSQTTAGRRIQTGSIHIIKGQWKVGTSVVKEALDAKGRRELWVQFHNDENFLTCDDCPHSIPGN